MTTTYRLVDVVDAEVADPSKRRARRDEVRDLLWGLVFDGTYGDFDSALAAYAEGRLSNG